MNAANAVGVLLVATAPTLSSRAANAGSAAISRISAPSLLTMPAGVAAGEREQFSREMERAAIAGARIGEAAGVEPGGGDQFADASGRKISSDHEDVGKSGDE